MTRELVRDYPLPVPCNADNTVWSWAGKTWKLSTILYIFEGWKESIKRPEEEYEFWRLNYDPILTLEVSEGLVKYAREQEPYPSSEDWQVERW